ncbi:protein kinase [bacterium]|nr:protein kinase [bacterium]
MLVEVVCPSCRTRVAPREGPEAGLCPRCRSPLPSHPLEAPKVSGSGSHHRIVAPSQDPQEVRDARSDPRRAFGRFILLSELGKGGMGVVYRAWDERLRRVVALKMVLERAADATGIERFQREAEVVARLRHPGIVSVHEVGEVQGRNYIAMDFIDGASLDRRLAGRGGKRLGFTRALEVLRDVARAVHYAHEQGVIHRDLKPANIMLDERDRPYVMDFGLARIRESRSGLTRTGAAIGTPAYMPPEQAEAKEVEADERADVYSLGATLYYILAGRPPFEGATEVNVLTALLTKEPAPPSSWNRRAAGDLDTICLRCLEKDPEKRYPSAAELGDELERYLAGDPIAARPIGALERVVRRAKRQKLAAALATATAVTLVAATAMGIRQAATMRELEAEKRAQERELTAKAVEEAAKAQVLLARGFIQRAQRASQEGRHREALVCAAKALSMPGLSDDDVTAARVAHFLAREGPWRKPRTFAAGDRKSIFALAWSPDGEHVAVAQGDGRVRIHAVADERRPPRVLDAAAVKGEALAVAWSPDRRMVASGGVDKTVRVHEPGSGRLLRELKQDGIVRGLAWSPSSDRLACVGDDGKLRLIEAESGSVSYELDCHNPLRSVAWSPDGRLVALGSFDQTVCVFALGDREQVVPVWQHRGEVRCVAWPPRFPRVPLLATSSYDRTVILWDVSPTEGGSKRLSVRARLQGLHENTIESVAWSPDGSVLATGNGEALIRLIVPQLEEQRDSELHNRVATVLEAHERSVSSVAFSPDGRRLASGGADGVLALWDLEPGRVAVLDHPDEVHGVAFSPDGRRLATACADQRVHLFDLSDTTHPVLFPDQGFRVFFLAWSPDSHRLAAGTGNPGDKPAAITVWDVATQRAEKQLEGSTVAWSRDGKWIATSRQSAPIQLIDSTAGFAATDVPEITTEANVAFRPDGRMLAVLCADSVTLFDVASRRPLGTLKGHKAQVTSLAWSPDGTRLASGGTDQTIRIFDVVSLKETSVLRSPRTWTTAVAWSPDGNWIVSGGPERSGLVLWDVEKARTAAYLPGHSAGVNAVAWSPDSRTIASASGDRTVRLWPLGKMLEAPKGDVLAEAERATGLRIPEGALDPVPGD